MEDLGTLGSLVLCYCFQIQIQIQGEHLEERITSETNKTKSRKSKTFGDEPQTKWTVESWPAHG